MEKINLNKRGMNNTLIWIVVIVAILLVLFFVFRGSKEGKNAGGETGNAATADEISNLDVGENPDMGVDDLNSLPASEEDITS